MSGPDDTIHPTEPATSPGISPIEAGKARLNVAGAFVDLLVAVSRAQAVCDAIARALDATVQKEPTT
jgi:hypothetical protein